MPPRRRTPAPAQAVAPDVTKLFVDLIAGGVRGVEALRTLSTAVKENSSSTPMFLHWDELTATIYMSVLGLALRRAADPEPGDTPSITREFMTLRRRLGTHVRTAIVTEDPGAEPAERQLLLPGLLLRTHTLRCYSAALGAAAAALRSRPSRWHEEVAAAALEESVELLQALNLAATVVKWDKPGDSRGDRRGGPGGGGSRSGGGDGVLGGGSTGSGGGQEVIRTQAGFDAAMKEELEASELLEFWAHCYLALAEAEAGGRAPVLFSFSRAIVSRAAWCRTVTRTGPALLHLLMSYTVRACSAVDGGGTYGLRVAAAEVPLVATGVGTAVRLAAPPGGGRGGGGSAGRGGGGDPAQVDCHLLVRLLVGLRSYNGVDKAAMPRAAMFPLALRTARCAITSLREHRRRWQQQQQQQQEETQEGRSAAAPGGASASPLPQCHEQQRVAPSVLLDWARCGNVLRASLRVIDHQLAARLPPGAARATPLDMWPHSAATRLRELWRGVVGAMEAVLPCDVALPYVCDEDAEAQDVVAVLNSVQEMRPAGYDWEEVLLPRGLPLLPSADVGAMLEAGFLPAFGSVLTGLKRTLRAPWAPRVWAQLLAYGSPSQLRRFTQDVACLVKAMLLDDEEAAGGSYMREIALAVPLHRGLQWAHHVLHADSFCALAAAAATAAAPSTAAAAGPTAAAVAATMPSAAGSTETAVSGSSRSGGRGSDSGAGSGRGSSRGAGASRGSSSGADGGRGSSSGADGGRGSSSGAGSDRGSSRGAGASRGSSSGADGGRGSSSGGDGGRGSSSVAGSGRGSSSVAGAGREALLLPLQRLARVWSLASTTVLVELCAGVRRAAVVAVIMTPGAVLPLVRWLHLLLAAYARAAAATGCGDAPATAAPDAAAACAVVVQWRELLVGRVELVNTLVAAAAVMIEWYGGHEVSEEDWERRVRHLEDRVESAFEDPFSAVDGSSGDEEEEEEEEEDWQRLRKAEKHEEGKGKEEKKRADKGDSKSLDRDTALWLGRALRLACAVMPEEVRDSLWSGQSPPPAALPSVPGAAAECFPAHEAVEEAAAGRLARKRMHTLVALLGPDGPYPQLHTTMALMRAAGPRRFRPPRAAVGVEVGAAAALLVPPAEALSWAAAAEDA